MSTDRGALARELLDRLEREEEKLLAWGVVDGGFTADEVAEVAQALIDERRADLSADDLRQELFDRRLLFAFREGLAEPHRTRMAEAVRLFAKLRQLFPNREHIELFLSVSETVGHLEVLEEEGKVERAFESGRLYFRAIPTEEQKS